MKKNMLAMACVVLAWSILRPGGAQAEPVRHAVSALSYMTELDKILIAEYHRPHQLNLTAQVLLGATDGEQEVFYWHELHPGVHTLDELALIERFNTGEVNFGERLRVANMFARRELGLTRTEMHHSDVAAQAYFAQRSDVANLMSNGLVLYDYLVFLDPYRRDMQRFLHSPGLAIAGMRTKHAIAEAVYKKGILYPGSSTVIEDEEFRWQDYSAATFDDMWGGFRRALETQHAILIFQGEDPHAQAMRDYYYQQGFAILSLPVGQAPPRAFYDFWSPARDAMYEAHLVGPCYMKAELRKIYRGMAGKIAVRYAHDKTHACNAIKPGDKDEL